MLTCVFLLFLVHKVGSPTSKHCNKILSKAIEQLKTQESVSEKVLSNHLESPLQSKPPCKKSVVCDFTYSFWFSFSQIFFQSASLQTRPLPVKRKIPIQSSENRVSFLKHIDFQT